MSDRSIDVSTTSSSFLPSRPAPIQNPISRAELLQQHPWLALDHTTPGPGQVDVCDQCATIEWDNLPSVQKEGAIAHHKYADLVHSLHSCQVCRVILYAVHWQREKVVSSIGKSDKPYLWASQWITGPVPDIDPNTRIWLFGAWKTAGLSMPPHWLVGFGCMLAGKDVSERLMPRDADGAMEKTTSVPNASVRICTEFGSPVTNIVPGRVRATNSNGEASFALAARWMKICRAQHDCEPKDSLLPSRVLAVSGDKHSTSIRLFETKGQVGAYVALSHSWGKGRHLTTTSDNIEAFKQEIPLNDLPKTFRDAVSITNILGFQYLWIDSLCIIQDSTSD